jgi:hypothetical protein
MMVSICSEFSVRATINASAIARTAGAMLHDQRLRLGKAERQIGIDRGSLVQMIDAVGIGGHRNAALSTSSAEILVRVQSEPGRKDSTRSNHVDLVRRRDSAV